MLELHGVVGAVPARRVDARGLVERVNLQARVVGDAREPGGLGVVERLQACVLGERRAGFLGLDDGRKLASATRARPDARRQRRGREDPVDLADLAGIGRGDDELHHARVAVAGSMVPTIVRCSATSSRMPLSPSAIRSSSAWRSKGGALGGALHLDEAAVAGLDDVHVHVGARVFVVGEVEHRHAADDADARRGDVVAGRESS